MRKRNIFKVFCLVCYVALLILFFVYSKTRKDSSEQESCIESACLRLCKTEQNSKFLNETIDDFEVTNPVTNLTLKYQVLNENPCESMRILENDQWKFSSGSILVNDTSIAENKYCLEFSEKNENETENPWLLVVCDDNSKLYEQLHVILSITAIAILAVVLLLYSFVNELKNLHGKCIIGFLFSILLACIYSRIAIIVEISPIIDVLINFALIFAFLWLNVLIFDVWWTLSFFDSSSGGKFKFYFYYVLGSAAVAFISALICQKFLLVSYAFLLLFILLCLSCFIFAAMKIYEMTGVEIDFGHKRFHYEQQRFLSYFQFFTLIMLTWTVEMCSRGFFYSHESQLIADILLCIQSFVVFTILVLKRNVREVLIRNICCC